MWVGRHSVVHLSPPLSLTSAAHVDTCIQMCRSRARCLPRLSPLLPIAPITGASKVISEFSLSHLASIPLVAPNPTGNCLHSSKERKGVRACVHVPGVIVKGKGEGNRDRRRRPFRSPRSFHSLPNWLLPQKASDRSEHRVRMRATKLGQLVPGMMVAMRGMDLARQTDADG